MNDEKRRGAKAIPDNVGDYLSEIQQAVLDTISEHGWSLKFVRRPSNELPIVVVEDKDGKDVGVLESNGAINYESGIVVRETN